MANPSFATPSMAVFDPSIPRLIDPTEKIPAHYKALHNLLPECDRVLIINEVPFLVFNSRNQVRFTEEQSSQWRHYAFLSELTNVVVFQACEDDFKKYGLANLAFVGSQESGIVSILFEETLAKFGNATEGCFTCTQCNAILSSTRRLGCPRCRSVFYCDDQCYTINYAEHRYKCGQLQHIQHQKALKLAEEKSYTKGQQTTHIQQPTAEMAAAPCLSVEAVSSTVPTLMDT